MNIILLGIQGSGKGTLVAQLQKHLSFTLISTGQLLRDEVKKNTDLGKHIHELLTAGKLVETETVINVISHKLNTCSGVVLFDGFPRNNEQAEKLNKILKVDFVIHLKLDKETALERLLSRLTCSNCGFVTNKKHISTTKCPKCGHELSVRSDDVVDGINKRFEIYDKETYPLIEKYNSLGARIIEVDASKQPSEICKEILKVIKDEYHY